MEYKLNFNKCQPFQWTDQRFGILVSENLDGRCQPIDIVSSLAEAEEIVHADLINRRPDVDAFCREKYILFLRGANGKFSVIGFWCHENNVSQFDSIG